MGVANLARDKLELLKQNGEIVRDIKGAVTPEQITIFRADVVIEIGDTIKRFMSNGATEEFQVINPQFYESFHGIPANYQIKVKKLGLVEPKSTANTNNYYLQGNNSRVNNNSTDNSNNVVINIDACEALQNLRAEIEREVLNENEKKESLEVVDVIQEQLASGKPSKKIIKTLLDTLPSLGNIASIASLIFSLVA